MDFTNYRNNSETYFSELNSVSDFVKSSYNNCMSDYENMDKVETGDKSHGNSEESIFFPVKYESEAEDDKNDLIELETLSDMTVNPDSVALEIKNLKLDNKIEASSPSTISDIDISELDIIYQNKNIFKDAKKSNKRKDKSKPSIVSNKMLEDSMIRLKFKTRLCKNLTQLINDKKEALDLAEEIPKLKGMNQIFVDYINIEHNRTALEMTVFQLFTHDFSELVNSKTKDNTKTVQTQKRKTNIKILKQLQAMNDEDINQILNKQWKFVISDYLQSALFNNHVAELEQEYRNLEENKYVNKFEELASNFVNYFQNEMNANRRQNSKK